MSVLLTWVLGTVFIIVTGALGVCVYDALIAGPSGQESPWTD